jgi:CBS domain containing-hemolysin-like protein
MIYWLGFTFLAIFIQGLFALFEMACVSFNRIRLQYYVSKGVRSAIWISFLIKRPSRLFGTTLLGVNAALQLGSECSRNFYESIHLDPDWAPLTQVAAVVIFGELVPMFTARKHPERIALFFAPLMIVIARIVTPITWTFDKISKGIQYLIKKPQETTYLLSREEVMLAFQEGDRIEDEFNTLTHSVFQLKGLTAGDLMRPLAETVLFPSTATVGEVRKQLQARYTPVLPIYHRVKQNVVSIVLTRDLLQLTDDQKIIDQGKSAWVVPMETPVLQLLNQYRRNIQSVAVILEHSGQPSGILTLDQIEDAIFGPGGKTSSDAPSHFVSRTLKGSMTIAQFNKEFDSKLDGDPSSSLETRILSSLDHPPSLGETVHIGDYKFTITEPTMRGIRTLSVHSNFMQCIFI